MHLDFVAAYMKIFAIRIIFSCKSLAKNVPDNCRLIVIKAITSQKLQLHGG